MAVSFGAVFYRCAAGQLAWMTGLPFALNLIFNFSFTPLQFGLHSNRLATADILLILITLVWALQVIRPFLFWVALVNIPYLLWVSFATVLQLTITSMNRGRP